MSGGHFNYKQDNLLDMVDDIRFAILINEGKERMSGGNNMGDRFSPKTIAEFEKAVKALKLAYVYAQRIDWLLSGDDGEDSFHIRLQAELGELK
jgi:hypothetical protein